MRKLENITKYIEDNNLGKYYFNKSFKDITTIRVGGKIELLYYPNTLNDFITFYKYAFLIEKHKILIIGCGSNILASDEDYHGIVVCLKNIKKKIEIKSLDSKDEDSKDKDSKDEDNIIVSVEAGVTSRSLSYYLMEKSITGGEAMSTIPGTIGGLVAMNASCYNFKLDEHISRCLCISDKGMKWYSKEELQFSYRRSSIISEKLIVLKAELIFKLGTKEEIIEKMKEIKKKREASQPLNYASAGCAFKNDSNYKAWELIDKAGLRGFTYRKAQVSNIHPNFIVNLGNAKSCDIYDLMKYVQTNVYEKTGILLENEWVIVNF